MAWIKFDKDLINDPRVLEAAEYLSEQYVVSSEGLRGEGFSIGEDLERDECIRFFSNAVTGALLALWVYADTHIRAGDVLPIRPDSVDSLVGIRGFCDLIDDEWLMKSEDGKYVVLPGYCDKNGLITKQTHKALNAARQRRFREKHIFQTAGRPPRDSNASSNALLTPLDQDQDQDLKRKNKVAPLALPEWLNVETWTAYVKTRKAKAREPDALKGALAKLEKFRAAGHDPNAIVAESLANGWQGLFAPKAPAGKLQVAVNASNSVPSIVCETCGKKATTWTGRQCDPCWRARA